MPGFILMLLTVQTWIVAEVDPPFLQLGVVPAVVFGAREDAMAVGHEHGVRGQSGDFGRSVLVRGRQLLCAQVEQLDLVLGTARLGVGGRRGQAVGACLGGVRGVALGLGRVVGMVL